MSLSAIIHTKNSQSTLKAALESVKFADEIIIVDMHSTDDSVKIARKYTDQIATFKDVGFVEPARNYGISKAKSEWVFVLDADEEASPELQKRIRSIVQREKIKPTAFLIARKNIIWDKHIEHAGWWPDYQLRLFKKGRVRWSEEIHSTPHVEGTIEKLPATPELVIIHHNYHTVSQYLNRLNQYTSITAQQLSNQPLAHPLPSAAEAFSSEFVQRFFAWEGYKGGLRAFSLSLLQAVSEMVVVLKRWEINQFTSDLKTERETIAAVETIQQTLNYWIADWHVRQSTGVTQLFWKVRRKLKV